MVASVGVTAGASEVEAEVGASAADEVGLVATGSVALGTISAVVDVVVLVAATGMINHPGSRRVVL